MKITLEISDEIIRDAIRDAVGSANIYDWADRNKGSWNPKTLRLTLVELEPDKGDEEFTLSRDSFAQGLAVMAELYPHHFADLVAGKGDMWTGNLLIQCAAFGEEKYS